MKTLRLNEEKEHQSPLTTENSNPSLPPAIKKKSFLPCRKSQEKEKELLSTSQKKDWLCQESEQLAASSRKSERRKERKEGNVVAAIRRAFSERVPGNFAAGGRLHN